MNESVKKPEEQKEEKKDDNLFMRTVKFIFVKNAALKGAALLLGFFAWVIVSVF